VRRLDGRAGFVDNDRSALEPPDATLVNRRWVPNGTVEWAKQAAGIMHEHGAVSGNRLYPRRHQARWRAQRLMRLMVDLGLHERWELGEHTDEHNGDGWVWTVEYRGKGST
jgi:hypothetical protein